MFWAVKSPGSFFTRSSRKRIALSAQKACEHKASSITVKIKRRIVKKNRADRVIDRRGR